MSSPFTLASAKASGLCSIVMRPTASLMPPDRRHRCDSQIGDDVRKIGSCDALENFGRIRLSKYFFMRDFLYSEIGNFYGIPNASDDPKLAIETGTRLATDLLDPLVETFGPIAVRSSYRGLRVNEFGNQKGHNCASNESNFAGHIWDQRDAAGRMGATSCIVVPWFADQYEAGRDWRDLAWWVHDHLPYSAMYFFPNRAAFNLTWSDRPSRTISSYIAPRGRLLASDAVPEENEEQRRRRYADFPPFRGVAMPEVPRAWQKEEVT